MGRKDPPKLPGPSFEKISPPPKPKQLDTSEKPKESKDEKKIPWWAWLLMIK